jgi:uncharacterized small protein (DUF1192 family)
MTRAHEDTERESLEERISALEAKVNRLEATVASRPNQDAAPPVFRERDFW